ncbi:unnamed protein product [Symbiodinium sp. CCMP2456]|nr:unnamed protein product [Symbiodinium sp. CCMP2456]
MDKHALYSENMYAQIYRAAFSKSMSGAVFMLLRALNHALCVGSGRRLADFRVPVEVADEEAMGFRCLNLLFGPMWLRGCPLPEYCHPVWGDVSRALNSSKLRGSVMKGTLLTNFYKGPFQSRTNTFHLKEAAKLFAQTASEDELDLLSPGYAFDMGLPEDTILTPEMVLQSPGISSNLPQAGDGEHAKSKQWFGIREAFDALASSWTVLAAVTQFSRKLLAAEDEKNIAGNRDDEQEAPPAIAAEEPATRKAFNLLRSSYANTADFVTDLFAEQALKLKLRLISFDLEDLHLEYSRSLQQLQRGQEAMMTFQAERSAGSWFHTINDMLARSMSPLLVATLGMHPAPMRGARPHDPEHPILQTDQTLVQLHWTFLVDLIANRVWSQSFYSLTWPFILAQAFLPEHRARSNASVLWKASCTAVLELESFVAANPTNGSAAALLGDIGSNTWQITREIFVLGTQTSWNPEDSEIRATAWALFASPAATKDLLESAFNFVKDSSERQSRVGKMSPWTRYSYLAVNPHAQQSGAQQSTVDRSDFIRLSGAPAAIQDVLNLKPFTPSATPLHEQTPSAAEIHKRWRPAGYAANRQSAAAMALTLKLKNDFRMAQHAWTGCFLRSREFYFHKLNKRYMLCLGFFKWCAAAIPAEAFLRPVMNKSYPTYEFCFDLSESCVWEHVPTRVLAAGALPADVGGYGCLPLIAGPQAPILESGIRAGMQLSVAELRNILQLRNIDPPPNKTGSGANGNVVKRDLVTVLVNALFPDMNEQTRTELIEKMAGKPRENTSLDESELNLKLVAHLDVQEQPHFKTIVKDALDHLEATKERARLKEKQREMHAAEGRDAPAAGVNPFAGAHGLCGERASAPRAKVFDWCRTTYHLCFGDHPHYDKDYAALLGIRSYCALNPKFFADRQPDA